MSASKLLYIFTQAPYSNVAGQEGLDAVLVGAAFEQDISLLFLHDGVFQLKANQSVEGTDVKQFTKAFKALVDHGVEDIYTHDLSLSSRGLAETELIIQTQPLDSRQVGLLIAEQAKVFTF